METLPDVLTAQAERHMHLMDLDQEHADEWAAEWSDGPTVEACANAIVNRLADSLGEAYSVAFHLWDNQKAILRPAVVAMIQLMEPEGIATLAAALDIAPTLDDFLAAYDGATDDRRDEARDWAE